MEHKDQKSSEFMSGYWRKALAGCECTPYPTLPAFIEQPVADKVVEYSFAKPTRLSTETGRLTTLIRAALASIIGHMTDSRDVVFGVRPVSERDNLYPVRIRMIDNQSVGDCLKTIEEQSTQMIPYEHFGLVEIFKISSDCQKACLFQTVLDIQELEGSSQLQHLDTYGLTIRVRLTGSQIIASAAIDSRMVEPQLAFKLLHRLGFVMQQLNNARPEMLLVDLETIPPMELGQIREWNNTVPPVVERCIHDVVKDRVLAEPDAPAVCAWDGEMTYLELDECSSKLAFHLAEIGVGPEKVVPLCFERSIWTVVAMLSVFKAGGAFILLDPGLPDNRIQIICQKVEAASSISSVICESRLAPFTQQNTVLCKQTVESLDTKSRVVPSQASRVTPQNAAYIIFTSGSTGEPKGCVPSIVLFRCIRTWENSGHEL